MSAEEALNRVARRLAEGTRLKRVLADLLAHLTCQRRALVDSDEFYKREQPDISRVKEAFAPLLHAQREIWKHVLAMRRLVHQLQAGNGGDPEERLSFEDGGGWDDDHDARGGFPTAAEAWVLAVGNMRDVASAQLQEQRDATEQARTVAEAAEERRVALEKEVAQMRAMVADSIASLEGTRSRDARTRDELVKPVLAQLVETVRESKAQAGAMQAAQSAAELRAGELREELTETKAALKKAEARLGALQSDLQRAREARRDAEAESRRCMEALQELEAERAGDALAEVRDAAALAQAVEENERLRRALTAMERSHEAETNRATALRGARDAALIGCSALGDEVQLVEEEARRRERDLAAAREEAQHGATALEHVRVAFQAKGQLLHAVRRELRRGALEASAAGAVDEAREAAGPDMATTPTVRQDPGAWAAAEATALAGLQHLPADARDLRREVTSLRAHLASTNRASGDRLREVKALEDERSALQTALDSAREELNAARAEAHASALVAEEARRDRITLAAQLEAVEANLKRVDSDSTAQLQRKHSDRVGSDARLSGALLRWTLHSRRQGAGTPGTLAPPALRAEPKIAIALMRRLHERLRLQAALCTWAVDSRESRAGPPASGPREEPARRRQRGAEAAPAGARLVGMVARRARRHAAFVRWAMRPWRHAAASSGSSRVTVGTQAGSPGAAPPVHLAPRAHGPNGVPNRQAVETVERALRLTNSVASRRDAFEAEATTTLSGLATAFPEGAPVWERLAEATGQGQQDEAQARGGSAGGGDSRAKACADALAALWQRESARLCARLDLVQAGLSGGEVATGEHAELVADGDSQFTAEVARLREVLDATALLTSAMRAHAAAEALDGSGASHRRASPMRGTCHGLQPRASC